MIPRYLEKKLDEALNTHASVALMGPRQVGKTTLALQIAHGRPSVYLDLENRLDLQKVQDIAAFYEENDDKLIILDEVQRLPEVFTQIRGLIDQERRKGNKKGLFLFLGSASIDLLQQSSETLAGRIAFLELFPVNAIEYDQQTESSKLNELWIRGGFPESLLQSDANSLDWRFNFIKTYLERDIPQLGPRIPAQTLERFWTMLAHNQGNPLNASQIGSSLGVSSVTIGRYVDLLVDMLLIRRLAPFSANIKKRLVKSPRVYVRDSGITHALLNIGSFNELLGHPIVGKSWEGFVIDNILSVLPPRVRPYYYRTAGGAEIDLILEFNPYEKWAIEIKRGHTFSLSKGFYESCNSLEIQQKFVIYPGKESFSLPHDVRALSLVSFMAKLRKQNPLESS